jgi:DNA-directed RNA polymerase specialized sigma24 family protein
MTPNTFEEIAGNGRQRLVLIATAKLIKRFRCEAEDVVQMALLAAYEWGQSVAVDSWQAVCTSFTLRTALRWPTLRQNRRTSRDETIVIRAEACPTPEEIFSLAERATVLGRAWSRLRPAYRRSWVQLIERGGVCQTHAQECQASRARFALQREIAGEYEQAASA